MQITLYTYCGKELFPEVCAIPTAFSWRAENEGRGATVAEQLSGLGISLVAAAGILQIVGVATCPFPVSVTSLRMARDPSQPPR